MTRYWLVHNQRAGQPAYVAEVARAAKALARRGVDVRLAQVTDAAGLRQAAREAVRAEAAAVLVAGGDGSLGLVAGELQGSSTALGCLPAGTANLWARQIDLPRPSLLRPGALERAALCLLQAPARLTDLGRCNGTWFLSCAGVGLDSYATQLYERSRDDSRRIGGWYYNLALTLKLALTWRALPMRLRVAGPAGEREIAGRYLMTTVANIGVHAGGVFHLTRALRLDDGLMDVWAFAGDGPADMFALSLRVVLGRHRGHPGVLRLTGQRMEIYTEKPQVIHVDAEPQPATQHLSIEVVPRCVRVLVPTGAAGEFYGAEPIVP